MRLRLPLLAGLGAVLLAACHSQESAAPVPTEAAAGATAEGSAAEQAVWATFHRKYPRLTITHVTEVATTSGEAPVYVVDASGKTFTTTAQVNFLVDGGTLIVGVGDNVRNVSDERARQATARLYTKLPMNVAISHAYGKGERKLVMFADPDCPVCQAFEAQLAAKGDALNATIYTFSFPLVNAHPDALKKAAYLMCTADPGAAWHDWMISADKGWDAWAATHSSKEGCELSQRAALGAVLAKNLGFSKTPTLMFPNGAVIEGAPTLDGLETLWAKSTPTL